MDTISFDTFESVNEEPIANLAKQTDLIHTKLEVCAFQRNRCEELKSNQKLLMKNRKCGMNADKSKATFDFSYADINFNEDYITRKKSYDEAKSFSKDFNLNSKAVKYRKLTSIDYNISKIDQESKRVSLKDEISSLLRQLSLKNAANCQQIKKEQDQIDRKFCNDDSSNNNIYLISMNDVWDPKMIQQI